MKYIFLLIFTLQNYNFCCEECCNCWEECWNNCWDNSTTDQIVFLQGENIINNDFALWKNKNTTKFETTDIKSGICEHENFYLSYGFPYCEQFYIPTKEEIQNKRNSSLYQDIPNYQYIVDIIGKKDDYCVIVKNIFPNKKDNNGNDNTSNLVYYVPVFLIYKKKEQNVYELDTDNAFFIFNEKKKIDFSDEKWYKNVNSWNKQIKKKIKNNLQNLENIKNNMSNIGDIYNIDLYKKNVSNMIYNNEGGNIIDVNFNLEDIKQEDRTWYRKGLENVGATCYMNATLQCFAHIPKFVTFFRQNQQVQNEIEKCQKNQQYNLTYAFAELFQNLYPTNLENMKKKDFYAPRKFKKTISKMNPLFEGIAANDAKDLVNFLIMTLHEELNKVKTNPNDNNDAFQDQTNKQNLFDTFVENFKKSYQSIISDLFYAVNCNTTQCGNCNIVLYNYQVYFFLIFPLEEVRKFKLQCNNDVNNNIFNNFNNFNNLNNNFNNLNNNNNNNNEVDIYDCFNYDKRPNYMAGENAMYCNYCRQTCDSSMKTELVTGPEILIIILNRGQGIQFKVKLNFPEKLNLSNYIELKDTGTEYDLFGVITHLGESGMGGHFIAYCKDLWDKTWYKYNDAIVSPVVDFRTEVVDYAMPYVLFYKKNLNNNNNNNI